MKRKIFSVLIAVAMLATFMPSVTFAGSNVNASPSKVMIVTAKSLGKKAVKLSWTKVAGAKSYVVKSGSKKLTVTTKTNYTVKKIGKKKVKKNKKYTFSVQACSAKNGKKPIAGVLTNKATIKVGAKAENVSALSKLTVNVGKNVSMNAKGAMTYITDNKSVATVSKGVVTGKGEGKANVYAISAQGVNKKCVIEVLPDTVKVTFHNVEKENVGEKVYEVEKGKTIVAPEIKSYYEGFEGNVLYGGKIKNVAAVSRGAKQTFYGNGTNVNLKRLVGWYTNAACTEGFEWNPAEPFTKDTELYGKWNTQTLQTINASIKAGDLIVIDGVDADAEGANPDGYSDVFRVLRVLGKNVELLAMTGCPIQFNANLVTTDWVTMSEIPDTGKTHQYEESNLDKYLTTTYFNKLPSNVKSALQDKQITQYLYSFKKEEPASGTYTCTELKFGAEGEKRWVLREGYVDKKLIRKVYALDVMDCALADTAAFGGNGNGIVEGSELNRMWFNYAGPVRSYRLDDTCWLRSTNQQNNIVWDIYAQDGQISAYLYNKYYTVRPAFTINMDAL